MPRPGTLWERGASNSTAGAVLATGAGVETVSTRAWASAGRGADAASAGWGTEPAPTAGRLYSVISPGARPCAVEVSRPSGGEAPPRATARPRPRAQPD